VRRSLFVLIVCGVLLVSAPIVLGEEDTDSDLPPGEGREEVEIYCSACHSLKIVTQQGLSREDWDELLVWMVDEQGMDELPPDDRKLILDYLAKHISIERVREMRKAP
jgi:cytochrome c